MSLATRLTLTYLLITLGGLLLLGGGAVVLAGSYDAQRRQGELDGQADVFAAYVAELAPDANALTALAPSLAQRAALPPDVAARIFRTDGALVSAQLGLGPFPSRSAAALAHSSLPQPISQSATRRYAARAAGSVGIVELSRPTDGEQAFVRGLATTVVQAALVAALAMALVSLLLARSLARPIARLRTVADTLAAGALHERAAPALGGRRDEIGALAASLDRMAAQLQARITEAEGERARLAAVLGGISEGVVAFDAAGNALFANEAARQLAQSAERRAQSESAEGLELLLALFDELGLPHIPERAIEHETQLNNRQLLLIGTPIQNPKSKIQNSPAAVWVLRDVTRVRALEQARGQFVRAVSHELRTPLTALAGTIENLRDDARPDQQAELEALEGEVARLGRLVGELLRPSPDGALPLREGRPVDVAALAAELCALLAGRAERAGVTLTYDAASGLPPVRGDRDRLRQALLNLLDNALKFTPAGGHVQVIVEASEWQGDAAVLARVEDDGPGVPPALGTHMWERGASEPVGGLGAGGAGLGLAIVREIARAHGGDAWAETVEPHGARFILALPIGR